MVPAAVRAAEVVLVGRRWEHPAVMMAAVARERVETVVVGLVVVETVDAAA